MHLSAAENKLKTGGYTCVLTDGESFYTSTDRGVKPLVQFIEKKTIPQNLFAADKVVGKATAYLYVILKIQALYAAVISEPAVAVLRCHGIAVSYDSLVPNIINRRGDGICPFEEAVMDVHDAASAYTAILKKMDAMQIKLWT